MRAGSSASGAVTDKARTREASNQQERDSNLLDTHIFAPKASTRQANHLQHHVPESRAILHRLRLIVIKRVNKLRINFKILISRALVF